MRKLTLLGLVLGSLLFVGCSQNVARFSVATTGNLPMKDVEKGDLVKGKDCITTVFFFGLGNTQNRVSGAVAKALEKAVKKGNSEKPADALVNVDISHSYWSAIFFGRDCYTAKGQAISVKN